MNLRETRKRRNSSISNNNADIETRSPASRTRSQVAKQAGLLPNGPSTTTSTAAATTTTTPRKARKKVRFSDPGPSTTGLTPALLRTSFDDGNVDSTASTPSRRVRRRRSTPLPRSSRCWHDARNDSADRVVQFTPLRQILDSRTQRRIRRTGLSDEINHIEREKRDAAGYEKTLQALRRERDVLIQELETAKRASGACGGTAAVPEEVSWMAPKDRIERLEEETSRLREEVSFSTSNDGCGEGNTVMLNDTVMDGDTILLSDSPDMRGVECQPAIPEGFSLIGNITTDASIQAQFPDRNQEAELRSLALDLEAARKEKRNLFEACRTHISSLSETAIENGLHQSSPPPDFLETIVPTLTATLARASNAAHSLEFVKEELSQLGFPGSSPSDIISELHSRFRTARIELERAVPVETPNASLNDGNATLGALVKRVEMLVKDLSDERNRHNGSQGRERALKGQFDTLLGRYEAASKKISDLEHSSSLSASDMLHTRMRMQELEHEGKEQTVGIDRLNSALSKYHEEVSSLEALVTGLENDKATCKEQYSQELSVLKTRVADQENARHMAEKTVAEREARIREMEQTVEHNRIRVSDLTETVGSLTREHQQAQDNLDGLEQHHEHELGIMNVRISELNTALQEANTEADVLRRNNIMLQEQLQLELEARDHLLDRWGADQTRSFALMKETVTMERRKAKVRAANFELKLSSSPPSLPTGNEQCQSEEPITPVSMSRHVHVDVGRGKERRRLDSGIGILTEDGLLEDVQEEGEHEPACDFADGVILPSDPACL